MSSEYEQPDSRVKRQLIAIEKANRLLHDGKIRLYQEALQDLLPTFLPDYPLRFIVIVRRPNKTAINDMVSAGRVAGQPPIITASIDGSLYYQEQLLGRLAKEDREILEGIGEDLLEMYSASIVEIKYDEEGKAPLYIAVELVRPELWIDSHGILRSNLAAEIPEGGQSAESATVPLVQALEEEVSRREGDEPRYARGSG